jgi:hypothetical protein
VVNMCTKTTPAIQKEMRELSIFSPTPLSPSLYYILHIHITNLVLNMSLAETS